MSWTDDAGAVASGSDASSAKVNARNASGIVTVADIATRDAAVAHSIPFPTGGLIRVLSDNTIYQRTSTGWTPILDYGRVNALAAPDLIFRDNAGADTGRLRLFGATNPTLFLYDSANQEFGTLSGATRAGETMRVFRMGASTPAGAELLSDDGLSVIRVRDDGVDLTTSSRVALTAPTLQLPATMALTIGGTGVAAGRLLGTNTAGNVAGLERIALANLPDPSAASDGQGLVVNSGAWGIGEVASSGGSGGDEILITAAPASDIATITSAASNVWGEWVTLATTRALTADETGTLDLRAQGQIHVTTASTGGGDRIGTEFRIVRTRGSMDTPIVDIPNYGPRNTNDFSGTNYYSHMRTTAQNFGRLVADNQAGDLFKLQVRVVSQASTARTCRAAAGENWLQVWRPAAGAGTGSPTATTFLALTDTPAAFGTAGQLPAVNAAGDALEFVDAPSAGTTLTANSVLAAHLALQDQARRQTFWYRGIYQQTSEVVSIQDMTITCGTTGSGAGTLDGASSAIGSSTSIRPNSFRPQGATRSYTINAVTQQSEAAGAPVAISISPDPGSELSAEHEFGIRAPTAVNEIRFRVSDATKTLSGGVATFTWSGNMDLEMSSGIAVLRVLEPIANVHTTIPTNFSALAGTVAPEQFRDNSIVPSRAIGGTLDQRAQWRTKSGFAALTSDTDRPLFYSGTQITQRHLPLGALSGVPTPNAQGQFVPGVTIWNTAGLENLPYGNASQILRMNSAGTGLEWQDLMTGGAGATAFSGLTGNLAISQLPSVTTADNFHVLEVVGGAWRLQQLPFSALTGNIGANQIAASTITNTHLAGSIAFAKLDLDNAAKQTAARSALGITQGAQTIADDTVLPAMLAADTDPQKLAFRARLGIPESVGYQLLAATMTTGQDLSGDVGYFATAPPVGSLSPATRNFQLNGSSYTLEEIHDDDVANSLVLVVNPGVPVADRNKITLSVDGRVFHGGDAAHQEIDEYGGTDISEFTWNNTGLRLANATAYEIAIGGALEDEIAVQIAAVRQLPSQVTTSEFKVLASNTANDWGSRTLNVDDSNQATFTANITTTRRTNSDSVVATLSTRTANTDIVSRSGNTLTIQKDGLYHIKMKGQARSGNTAVTRWYFVRNNTGNVDSRMNVGYPGPTDYPGEVTPIELNRNDTLRVEYLAFDATTSAPKDVNVLMDVTLSRVEVTIS